MKVQRTHGKESLLKTIQMVYQKDLAATTVAALTTTSQHKDKTNITLKPRISQRTLTFMQVVTCIIHQLDLMKPRYRIVYISSHLNQLFMASFCIYFIFISLLHSNIPLCTVRISLVYVATHSSFPHLRNR